MIEPGIERDASAARSQRGRPVAVVVVVGSLAWGLLWLALVQGWLGADVDRGAQFCEASRDGLIKQPVSSLSNLAFWVAGLFIAVDVGRRSPSGRVGSGGEPRFSARGGMGVGFGIAYAVTVVLLGPASAAMHASESVLGGDLDTFSMYLLASFTTAYAVARLRGWGTGRFLGVLVGLVVVCELVAGYPRAIPLVETPGNLIFAGLLLLTLALEARLARRAGVRPRWGVAAALTMVVALVIWTAAHDGTAFCHPTSLLQGHGAWHALDALAAWFLYRHYVAVSVTS